MSIRAAEGGRAGPEGVSFTHQLLSTHITALSSKGSIVFIGEGQHCHVHDVVSGRQVASTQVFCAAVVHGLRIQPGPVDGSAAWHVLVFGQKSVAVLLYLTAQRKFYVLLGESSIEDWIIDAGLEKDLSHIIIATAHNSLLRCRTPNLVEHCRKLSEYTSGGNLSKPVAKTPHHCIPEASPGTQEPGSVDLVNRVKEQTSGGNFNKPVLKTSYNSILEASPGTEEPGSVNLVNRVEEQTSDCNASSLVQKAPHYSTPEASPVTQELESIDLVNRIKTGSRCGSLALKEGGSGGGLTVVARVACVEKCVLFSGRLVMMSGCWEGAVMLAGTMALQVMVWGPWGPRDSDGSALPLHCLWGHQGSIFSITFNPSQGLITTTSDDRSLRVWEVVRQDTHTPPDTLPSTTLPATPEEEQLYWASAKITEKFALYGHRARVWRSLILPSYLVSVGEDSTVCIWEHTGALVASWRAHEGASIWSVTASEGVKASLITGGADGSVKAWSMSAVVPVRAEPVDGVPWGGTLGHGECVKPTGRCSEVITKQRDTNSLLNSEEEKSNVAESSEIFRDTPQKAVPLKIRPSTTALTADIPVVTTEPTYNELLLNSEEGEYNVSESHELFISTPQKALKEKPSTSATATVTATIAEAATGFPECILRMGENNEPEFHELFSNTPQKPSPLKSTPSTASSETTDFPRCLGLIGDGMAVVVTNSGKLYSNSHEGSWCLAYEDERLRNYAILEASPDRRRVAVGTLTGAIVVLHLAVGGRRLVVEVEAEGPPGKVFALQWLTADCVLALGAAGVMTTWEIQAEGTVRAISTHHLPVSMHRWLCAVYVSSADNPTTTTIAADTTMPATSQHLICGDRAGSLHLYTLTDPRSQDTLRGIHGKNGVTSLLSWGGGGIVYSSGRDGCVRSLRVCGSGAGEGGVRPYLQPLTVTRVCGASWVAQLLCVWGKLLAVCFHGVKLRLWDVEAEQALLEVECGGAHRSWDLLVCGGEQGRMVFDGDKGNQVYGEEGSLVCGFLKDGLPYTFSTSLTDKLLPIIKPPLNSQETMSVCVLHQQGSKMLLVTAGEDTTLRLHALRHPGQLQPLAVLRSHLSGVRALCLMEGLGSTLRNGAKEEKGSEWRGPMADGTQDNGSNGTGKNNGAKNNGDREWRRQMADDTKEYGTQDNGAVEGSSGIERRGQVTNDTGKESGTVWMVSAGGRAEFKVWQCSVNKSTNTTKSSTRASIPYGTSIHSPRETSDVEGDQELGVTCREVGSHMLRTGSHKTWRNQQLTFDPETRYMAAAAHWVTSSLALVALASSDGFLRIFSFQSGGEKLGEVRGVEEMQLGEVCVVECGCCLLSVARLGIQTRTILVTCSTKGHVTFWDLQAVVEWLVQNTSQGETSHGHSPPQPSQVTSVAAHQSGVNSITFHHHQHDPTCITMATGGDDNKISVWEVMVEEKLDGVEVVVAHRCSVFGHASQVSGVAWLSGEHLLSISIDQRLVVWKYNRGGATQREPTEKSIFHIEPRALNEAARQEVRNIQKGLTEDKIAHIVPRKLNKTTRQEDRTMQREPSEDRTTHLEPGEPYRARAEATEKEPSEPSQITRPDDNTTNHQTLVPLGSCFTGVPDVKGIAVTDVDNGKKMGKKSQAIEKRVFVYGMGLQGFDVTVGGSVR